MMTTDKIEVTLSESQGMIQIINANKTYCLWPRGGGKTSAGIGPRIQRLSDVMPRSQILIVSDTYERLENRVIPNIIGFLTSKLGLVEAIDFVKYKKPPEHWEKPLIPLDKFDRVISFASGTALCLVSLAVEGSGNAFNAQAAIIDEAKFCKEEKITTEVLPALRGSEDLFGHLPEYLSTWFFTDKYGENIHWLLQKRKLVNQKAVDVVRTLQEEIIRLDAEIAGGVSDWKAGENRRLIKAYEAKINSIRKHIVYVSDMKAYENLPVLGEFYFKSQKRICQSEIEYNVAILNHDPDKVEHTFYPTFTKANKYSGLHDYNPMRPFYGAFDYNFRIAPLPVAQFGVLPGRTHKSVNFIDYVYELHPLGVEDTINTFCKRYAAHNNKVFHYVYDHTAKGRNTLKKTYQDAVKAAFKNNKWKVIEHDIGNAPEHDVKFQNLKSWLTIEGEYSTMVNELTCEQLIRSIELTPAEVVSGKTRKDKRTEKNPKYPAEDAPHGSDAFDMLLIAVHEYDMRDSEQSFAVDMGVC